MKVAKKLHQNFYFFIFFKAMNLFNSTNQSRFQYYHPWDGQFIVGEGKGSGKFVEEFFKYRNYINLL